MSHFVINLKWMIGGHVNPFLSIITDYNNINNNYNNNNDNKNKNNNDNNILNFSSGGGGKCSHQLRPSRLQCGRPRDHEMVSIAARVCNKGNLNLNFATIRIMRLRKGNKEIRFHHLRRYV